jgi:hypothetical protein
MNTVLRRLSWMLLVLAPLLLAPTICVGNDHMGKLDLDASSHALRNAGVWIDGQYVGYVKELKGDDEVHLLPGDHVITVRQNGYQDFTETINVEPGRKTHVRISMERAAVLPFPAQPAEVKFDVTPYQAAVFMDGKYVGHADEFQGPGRGMLIAPGAHQFEIALPGYEAFDTDIDPIANQKVVIKTDLLQSNAPLSGLLIEQPPSAVQPGAMAAPMAAPTAAPTCGCSQQ